MKTAKTATLATVTFLALMSMGHFGYSQEKLNEFMTETSPEDRAQLQTDYMKESLSLTGDQEAKIHEVNLKYAQKIQEAYEAPTKRNHKLKIMKGMNIQKEGELKFILSADQYATYEKNKKAMREKINARVKEKEQEQ